MVKSPDEILKDLEMLTEEIKEKSQEKEKKKVVKTKKAKKTKSRSKEPEVTKKLQKSLELLEKEVFIKIDDPLTIARDLLHSKKVVKGITTTLMALTKVNKLREELVENLNRHIEELKEIVISLEDNLNLDHYKDNIKGSSLEAFNEYIDTIENDIEEIRRNIGLAK